MSRIQRAAPKALQEYLIYPGDLALSDPEDARLLLLIRKLVDSEELKSVWGAIENKWRRRAVILQPSRREVHMSSDSWAMNFVSLMDLAMSTTSKLQRCPQARIDWVWDKAISNLREVGEIMTEYADDESLCPYAYDIYYAALSKRGMLNGAGVSPIGEPFDLRADALVMSLVQHLMEQRRFGAREYVQEKKSKRPDAIAFLRKANEMLKEVEEISWYSELAVIASVLYDWEGLDGKTVRRYCETRERTGG